MPRNSKAARLAQADNSRETPILKPEISAPPRKRPARPRQSDTAQSGLDQAPLFDPLLTVAQVAEWLGVAKQTVYNWRGRGYGPVAVKFGNDLRYRHSDVEAWIEAHLTGPAA